MEEVLAYQIWLLIPEETRAVLAKLFSIPKTGSVNVEYRATGPVVTRDGYNPDDLRAITTDKMQTILDTDETDFYGMAETIIDNVDAIVKGTFKYRPNKKKDETAPIVVGDRVLIKDAWEDDDGKTGDATATVLKIDKKGKLKLQYDTEEIAEALGDFVYTVKDVQKVPPTTK